MVYEDRPDTPTHLDGLTADNAITFDDWSHPDFMKMCAEHRHGARESGYKWGLGVINGVFDLCHLGHINLVNQACELDQKENTNGMSIFLVALLNTDASAARLKGPNRPIIPLSARMWSLAMLSGVQAVAGFDEDTPEEALKVLRPDFLFKGAEYTMRVIPGADHCGAVIFLPETPGYRTSEIEKKIVAAHGGTA